jgi:hypothetical protein
MIIFFDAFFIIDMLIFAGVGLYKLFEAVIPVIIGVLLIGGITLGVVLARKINNYVEDNNDYTPELKDDYWCN